MDCPVIISFSTSSEKGVGHYGMYRSVGLMQPLEKRSTEVVLLSSPSSKTTQVNRRSHGESAETQVQGFSLRYSTFGSETKLN